MQKLWRSYGQGIVFIGLFLIAWVLMSWAGWVYFWAQQHEHHQTAEVFGSSGYLWFWGQQTFSNWQSDLLGQGLTVILGAYLLYKGSQSSRESADHTLKMVRGIAQRLDGRKEPATSISESENKGGIWHNYSLGIILMAAFVVFWILQTWMGWNYFVSEQAQHHETATLFGASGYFPYWAMSTLENWQSDLFGAGLLVILCAYFIYKGSSQSKDTEDEIEQLVEHIEQRTGELTRTPGYGQLVRETVSTLEARESTRPSIARPEGDGGRIEAHS